MKNHFIFFITFVCDTNLELIGFDMKRYSSLFPFLLGFFVLLSCQKTQAPELAITGSANIESLADGSSSSITFTSNRDWSASSSESWIHVSPSSGTASEGPITVSIRCDANNTYEDRSGTVIIRAENLSQTILVKQPANLGIVLPTQVFDLQSDSRTIEVEVKANVEYSVDISADWIKQTGTKALTSKILVFSVEENTSYDAREGRITIKPQNDKIQEQVISVKQAQKDAIHVKKTSYEIPYGGGEVEIKVESNVSFDVKPSVDWIHYTQTKALSSSTVCLKIDENESSDHREGVVVIAQQNGSISHAINVKQAGRFIPVETITISPDKISVNKGDVAQIYATVLPEDATDKSIIWKSSNSQIVSVENGRITAINKGVATVYAISGNVQGKCEVTVTNNIVFADARIKELCVKNWDTDQDGELSYEEAAAVVSIGTVFKEEGGPNDKIISFDEFQFFTGITTLAKRAFAFCSKLESIILPNSIEKFEDECFYYCRSLTQITLPSNVKSIGESTFSNCTSLTTINLNDGLTEIGSMSFASSGIKTLSIPSTITSMGVNMFVNCKQLESIRIPDSIVLTNTSYFFSKCSALKKVYLGKGVTVITEHCFQNCSSLEEIEIAGDVVEIGFEAFSDCRALERITLPSTVEKIGYWAFRNCKSLKEIIIPASVNDVERQCFSDCESLTKVDMSASKVTYLRDMVFAYCSSLSEVFLPEGLEITLDNCFIGCPSLKRITFPNTYREMDSFIGGAVSAEEIIINSSTPPISRAVYDDGILREAYKIKRIMVPSSSVDTYKATAPWSEFQDCINAIE